MKAEGTIKPANLGFRLGAAGQFLFCFLTTNRRLHGSQLLAASSQGEAEMYPKALRDAPRVGGGSWRARLCVWLEWLICPVGKSPSLGAVSMSVMSCVYLTAKARGGNAVHGGFVGCVHKFRRCFSCLSDAHGYRRPLQRSLCTATSKLFLHPAPQGCHVLPPSIRWLFSEKL